MKIKPLSQAEIAEKLLIPEGPHPCCIRFAGESVSQFGTPMMVLTIEVMSEDGEVLGRLTDRITEKIESGQKLRAFCEAFGLLEAYESGELSSFDLLNRSARCEVTIKRSAKYGTRNEIKRYFADDRRGGKAS